MAPASGRALEPVLIQIKDGIDLRAGDCRLLAERGRPVAARKQGHITRNIVVRMAGTAPGRKEEQTSMKFANPAPLGSDRLRPDHLDAEHGKRRLVHRASVPLVLASAFAFGGTAQFFAGLMEMPRGNTFGFVAFCSYGAFWWSFALFVQFFAASVPADFVGWWLVMWGVFTFYMWIGSLALNRAVQLVFLALVDHLLPARRRRLHRHGDAAHRRWLHGAAHRGTGLLPGRRRGHQRNPRPHGPADRRADASAKIAGRLHQPA